MTTLNINTIKVPATARNKRIYDTGSTASSTSGSGGSGGASVTIDPTPNGLLLTGSVLSLALATGSTTGALSSTNWTTFNSKEPAITAGSTSHYWRGDKSFQTLDKTAVSLSNVDNTSDVNKPVSTATTTQLNLKANIASPTFTGTVSGITATMVGLGNVNNTADTAKPVSTAQQTALDLKANLASPTFTGTVAGITKAMVGLSNVDNTSDASKPLSTAVTTALASYAPIASPTFTGSAVSPIYESPTYKIRNSGGTVKWTVSVDASDNLQFLNASGVVEAVLTQAGALKAKGEITAYATI